MELLIEAQQVPEYRWNYEEIKAAAVAKAKEYATIAYTDADEAVMKKDRADLNRIINGIDGERKRIKKECMAPYEAFEAQVKDVLEPLREAVDVIDKGLSEIEKAYRDGKTAQMKALYDEALADVSETVPFEKTVREEWYKKSFTDKKLEKAYLEQADQIHKDLAILEEMELKYRTPAISMYLKAFSLSNAQAEAFRLQKLDEVLEQRKKAQEERERELAEKRAQAEKAAAEARAAEATRAVEKPQEVAVQSTPEQSKLNMQTAQQEPAGAQDSIPAPQPDETWAWYGPLWFYGNKDMLIALSQWMKANGMKCRKDMA